MIFVQPSFLGGLPSRLGLYNVGGHVEFCGNRLAATEKKKRNPFSQAAVEEGDKGTLLFGKREQAALPAIHSHNRRLFVIVAPTGSKKSKKGFLS